MDLLEELLELVKRSEVEEPELRRFIKEVVGIKRIPPLKQSGKVITYSKVIRHYTCLHCEKEFQLVQEIPPKAQILYTNNSGDIKVETLECLDIECGCARCSHCKEAIKDWERASLERRYLLLLDLIDIKGVIKAKVSGNW